MSSKTALNPDDRLLRRDDVVCRSLDGRAILLCPGSCHPFRLNEVGTAIWELLDRHGRLEDLLERVHEIYPIDREVLARDVTAFLTELLERNLVKAA